MRRQNLPPHFKTRLLTGHSCFALRKEGGCVGLAAQQFLGQLFVDGGEVGIVLDAEAVRNVGGGGVQHGLGALQHGRPLGVGRSGDGVGLLAHHLVVLAGGEEGRKVEGQFRIGGVLRNLQGLHADNGRGIGNSQDLVGAARGLNGLHQGGVGNVVIGLAVQNGVSAAISSVRS